MSTLKNSMSQSERSDQLEGTPYFVGKVAKLEPKQITTEGTVKVTVRKENGMEEELEVKFADGFPTIRPIRGKDVIARTQDVMNLARGEVKEILDLRFKKFAHKPKLAAAYSQPLPLSQEDALHIITNLAQMGTAMIKTV